MKSKKFVLIMVTAIMLVGCSTPQSGNGYIPPQQINEPKIEEISPVFETQIERVNNCDGTNPSYNVSYKTIEEQRANFEVSVGAGGLTKGTPIPFLLEVQLEAKITAAIDKDFGLTTERKHEITLNNVQGTYLEHTITWKVKRAKGIIEVIYGDGIAQVGFEKIANVELYDRTSKTIGCDSTANFKPTEIESTETPLVSLQTEPPPTEQQSSGVCQESGGASGFSLSQKPSAPRNGCVLVVEWWVPPNSANCGIIITTNDPIIPKKAIGAWWYVYSQRPDSHKEEYLAKNPKCEVQDLR
jgi:hypothetical protein